MPVFQDLILPYVTELRSATCSQMKVVQSGKKVLFHNFCDFLLVCRITILKFFGSQETLQSLKIFCRPYTCLGEEIGF